MLKIMPCDSKREKMARQMYIPGVAPFAQYIFGMYDGSSLMTSVGGVIPHCELALKLQTTLAL